MNLLEKLFSLDLGEGDVHWTLNKKYIHIQYTELVAPQPFHYHYMSKEAYENLKNKLPQEKRDETKVVFYVEKLMHNFKTPDDCISKAIEEFESKLLDYKSSSIQKK